MTKAGPVTWVCPVCGRRVPRREAECFCGAKRQAAEQHHQKEQQKKSTRIPMDVALLVLSMVLIAVYAIHRVMQPSGPPDAGAVAVGAALAVPSEQPALPIPVAPTRAPRAPAEEPSLQRAPPPPQPPPQTPPPEAPAVHSATPTPAATPTPVDERAQVRAAGLAAFEAALGRLASAAGQVERYVRDYQAECSSAQRFARVSNCAEMEAAIGRELQQIQQGLDAAEDDARRAWLNPGQVRDARGRSVFGTRQWEETVSAARNLRR